MGPVGDVLAPPPTPAFDTAAPRRRHKASLLANSWQACRVDSCLRLTTRRRGRAQLCVRVIPSAAAGAGAALALVHGLHPGDRDGAALLDQVGAEVLRRRHRVGPGLFPAIDRAAVRGVKSAG